MRCSYCQRYVDILRKLKYGNYFYSLNAIVKLEEVS